MKTVSLGFGGSSLLAHKATPISRTSSAADSSTICGSPTTPPDLWDPNNWDLSPKLCRLYLDDHGEEFLVLQDEDFWWACNWRWHINKPHKTRYGSKRYATRSPGWGGQYKPKLYLHVEIMKRTGILPPSDKHTLVDHIDGNEFNCCRSNLRWATVFQNNWNRADRPQLRMFDY